jgi:hypothetical protein
MCISKEDRCKKKFRMTNPNHVLQMFKERGKHLFGKDKFADMLEETTKHIKDDSRCVIIPDERTNGNKSSHIAVFLTDYGGLVAIPLYIDEEYINILTIKDVLQDDNPNWHIKKYNEIGASRGISPLPLQFRTPN